MDLAEKKRELRLCRVSPGCPPVLISNHETRPRLRVPPPPASGSKLFSRDATSSGTGPRTHIQVPPLNSKAEGDAGGTRSRNLSGAARAHPSALGPGPSRAPLPLDRLTPKQVSLQPQLAAFAQRGHSVEAEAGKCPSSPCPGAFPHLNRTEWKLHEVPTPRAPSRLAPGGHVGIAPQPRTLRPP